MNAEHLDQPNDVAAEEPACDESSMYDDGSESRAEIARFFDPATPFVPRAAKPDFDIRAENALVIERNRLRSQEWHDSCASCSQRYQGMGDKCKPCSEKAKAEEAWGYERRALIPKLEKARYSLPPWSDWATFDGLKSHQGIHAEILRAALEWRRSHGSLVLLGPTGVGKSACAHAIARRVIQVVLDTPNLDSDDRGFAIQLRWVTASALARARRQHGLGKGEAEGVERAVRASLLIIDELGFEPDPGDGVIFDVVHERYENRTPTVVTSGRTEAELVERYGAAFVRRLREPGRIVSVHK